MFIFLFISGFWVFMLSNKYKEFTIGTTGRFIYAAAGPKYNLFSPISISSLGFLKPPNETAISIWEDPSCVRLESWSPMQSRNSFLYQLKLSSKNIYTVSHYMLQKVSLFSALIIFAYILFCIMPLQSLISESIGLYPLLTVVLYPLGYLIVAVVDRHLWLVCILLLLMGAELLTMLLRSNFFIGAKKEVTKAVFVLSFLLLPFYNLILNFNGGRDIYTLSRVLSSYGIRGNVVSNKTDAPTNKNWHMTLYLSYYLGNHYYGEVPGKTSDKEPQGLFLQNNIDYYFFWGKASDAPEFLFKYKEKTGAKFPGLRIYSLKERA